MPLIHRLNTTSSHLSTPMSRAPLPRIRSAVPLVIVLLWTLVAVGPVMAGQAAFDLDPTLQIGHDLKIAVVGASAHKTYTVSLLDEYGDPVASQEVTTDANGAVDGFTLWQSTGVVGCDDGTYTQAADYLFDTYESAQAFLAGRTFDLELRSLGGGLKASATVDLVGRTDPLFFFSDASACPREKFFEDEPVYVSGRQVPPGERVSFFMIEAPGIWLVGMELEDVRALYASSPQNLFQSWETTSFTELVTPACELPAGPYGGVIRLGEDLVPTLGSQDPTMEEHSQNRTWGHCDKGPDVPDEEDP